MIESLNQVSSDFDSKWTMFIDTATGGWNKFSYEVIIIELPYVEAIKYFEIRFGRNPKQASCGCGCCGMDYIIGEYESLENAVLGSPYKQMQLKVFAELSRVLICAVDGKINRKLFEKFDFLEDLNRKNENVYV